MTRVRSIAPNGFKGTFAFTSSIPISAVAMRGVTNKTGEFLFSALPMAADGGSGDSPILPLFADGAGWSTQVVLMNNSSAAQSGTVQFFGQGTSSSAAPALQMTVNGVTGTSFNYSIPPRSIARLTTAGASPVATGGSIRITPASQEALSSGSAPDAFAIVSFRNNGTILSETSFSAAPTGTAFRTYVESTTSPEIANSTVAFANPTAATNVVTFQFLQLDGTPVGAATSIALPAGSQMSRFVRELYSGLPEQFVGQLRVTSSAPIAVTAFRTKYNGQGDFMFTPTAVVNEASPPTGLMFPLVATGNGYDTQLVLFGPAGQAGAGEMLFYSKDGVIRTGSSLGIAP